MENILTGPQSAIQERKTLGAVILNDVKDAMDFLNNQITPLVANFQSTPEFFIGFHNNKRIGLPDTRHTRLLATCKDELGKSYANLIVTVDAFTDIKTGKSYPAASAFTDPNGVAEVIEFFAGYRTVSISGQGIESQTFPAIQFENGKAVSHTFTIKPKFTNIPAPQESKQTVEK